MTPENVGKKIICTIKICQLFLPHTTSMCEQKDGKISYSFHKKRNTNSVTKSLGNLAPKKAKELYIPKLYSSLTLKNSHIKPKSANRISHNLYLTKHSLSYKTYAIIKRNKYLVQIARYANCGTLKNTLRTSTPICTTRSKAQAFKKFVFNILNTKGASNII